MYEGEVKEYYVRHGKGVTTYPEDYCIESYFVDDVLKDT